VVKQLIAGMAAAMIFGVAAVSCTRPTGLPFLSEYGVGLQPAQTATSVVDERSPTVPPADAPSTAATMTSSTTAPPASSTVLPTPTHTIAPTTLPVHPPGVLIIGDSVLEGLNVLGYRFGSNTTYDTEVARSVLQLDSVLVEHEPPANLVIHLGTNGWWPTTKDSFESTLTAFDDRQIVLVNVSVDRTYTELANQDLADLAKAHDHVILVDWNSIASPEIVRDDGYHPKLEGYEALARLIADALGLPASYQLVPPPESSAGRDGALG